MLQEPRVGAPDRPLGFEPAPLPPTQRARGLRLGPRHCLSRVIVAGAGGGMVEVRRGGALNHDRCGSHAPARTSPASRAVCGLCGAELAVTAWCIPGADQGHQARGPDDLDRGRLGGVTSRTLALTYSGKQGQRERVAGRASPRPPRKCNSQTTLTGRDPQKLCSALNSYSP